MALTPLGIEDTTNGQCDAHVMIRGEDFRCDLAVQHDGWAHSNSEVQTIWQSCATLAEVRSEVRGLLDSLDEHVIADEDERENVYEAIANLWAILAGADAAGKGV